MSFKFANKSGSWMLMAGLLAGGVFLLAQNSPLVTTAQPPVNASPERGIDTAYYQADAPQVVMPEVVMKIGGETFEVEVAVTREQLMRGLMFRTELAPKRGMLFYIEPPRIVNFWMKNTKIPLDMVFIRRGQVIHVIHGTQPCLKDPCPEFNSAAPVDTVVELPAGTAQQFRLDPGVPAMVLSRTDTTVLHQEAKPASDAVEPALKSLQISGQNPDASASSYDISPQLKVRPEVVPEKRKL